MFVWKVHINIMIFLGIFSFRVNKNLWLQIYALQSLNLKAISLFPINSYLSSKRKIYSLAIQLHHANPARLNLIECSGEY